MIENVEGHFLFVLLHVWTRAYILSLYLYIHGFIFAYASLFLRLYVGGF